MLSINLSDNKIIKVLITSKNNPSVIIVIGNVRNINMGFINVFSTANKIAKRIADVKLLMCTPDNTFVNP